MKKLLIMLISVMLLTGCMGSKTDILKSFKDYNSKKDTYLLTGSMSLISNEDEFTYDLSVSVKDNEYYKVSLLNTINNHEQIILKNDEGVFVVTPNLNKSFKFMSEWPNNSSQAYIVSSLINDINKDENAKVTETKDGYEIVSKVNYPNNQKLVSEKITTDKKYNIKMVEVMDSDSKVQIKVKVKDIDYSPKFDDEVFNLDDYVDETKESEKDNNNNKTEDCLSTCKEDDSECKNTCTKEDTQNTSNILDEIIYPLYVPNDTYLSSKDTVNTDEGNRVILTFAGVDPFILVEEVAQVNSELDIVPVNGEPVILGGVIGAISDNSLYWTSNGVDYYLTSNTLDNKEMMTIAESVQNSSSLVASTK